MKEIGPIPGKLWPFYDFFGPDTLVVTQLRVINYDSSNQFFDLDLKIRQAIA